MPKLLFDGTAMVDSVPEKFNDRAMLLHTMPAAANCLPAIMSGIPGAVYNMPELCSDMPKLMSGLPRDLNDIPKSIYRLPEIIYGENERKMALACLLSCPRIVGGHPAFWIPAL
jgi:hypothetical protein